MNEEKQQGQHEESAHRHEHHEEREQHDEHHDEHEHHHEHHGEHEHHHEHHEEHHEFRIQIDRVHYVVNKRLMTGEQLRQVPSPPIGPDRDLFEVVPGGTDRKISDKEEVEIRDGKRFFTAPAQINPGRSI